MVPELLSLDVLVRMSLAEETKATEGVYHEPDTRRQEDNARHFAKYVFPRQFKMANPFQSTSPGRGPWQYTDFADRETEIKAGVLVSRI